MTLYDGLINQMLALLPEDGTIFPLREAKLNPTDKNDILFLKDTAFELGGSSNKCVSSVAVTSSMHFQNNIALYGKDISDIKCDCPFGKIVLLEIEDIDEENAFDKIKDLENVRYNFYREGFMTRASALNMREQIRVSKKAVKHGVSLADYGSEIIREYLSKPLVKSVKVIFFTDGSCLDELYLLCDKIKNTTSALNHILDNVIFDCKSCNLKEICDEVEGMKELHMKKSGKMQKS